MRSTPARATRCRRSPRRSCAPPPAALCADDVLTRARRFTRGWRWHKEHRLWLTRDPPGALGKAGGGGGAGAGELATFWVWDTDAWAREPRDLAVLFADLEERAPAGAFPHTNNLAYPGQAGAPGQGQGAQGQGVPGQSGPGVGAQGQPLARAFQPPGIAAM
jgi:hypothetical protein